MVNQPKCDGSVITARFITSREIDEQVRYPSPAYPGEMVVYEKVPEKFIQAYLVPSTLHPDKLVQLSQFQFLLDAHKFKKAYFQSRNEPCFNRKDMKIINKMDLPPSDEMKFQDRLPISLKSPEMWGDRETTKLVTRQLYSPNSCLSFHVLRIEDMNDPILAIIQTNGRVHNNNLFEKDGKSRRSLKGTEEDNEDFACHPVSVASIRYLGISSKGLYQVAHAIYHNVDKHPTWTNEVCMED